MRKLVVIASLILTTSLLLIGNQAALVVLTVKGKPNQNASPEPDEKDIRVEPVGSNADNHEGLPVAVAVPNAGPVGNNADDHEGLQVAVAVPNAGPVGSNAALPPVAHAYYDTQQPSTPDLKSSDSSKKNVIPAAKVVATKIDGFKRSSRSSAENPCIIDTSSDEDNCKTCVAINNGHVEEGPLCAYIMNVNGDWICERNDLQGYGGVEAGYAAIDNDACDAYFKDKLKNSCKFDKREGNTNYCKQCVDANGRHTGVLNGVAGVHGCAYMKGTFGKKDFCKRRHAYHFQGKDVATNYDSCKKYFNDDLIHGCHKFDDGNYGGGITSNCKQCVAAIGHDYTGIHGCAYVNGGVSNDICEPRHSVEYDERKDVAIDEATCDTYFDYCHDFDAGEDGRGNTNNCKKCVAAIGDGNTAHECAYVQGGNGKDICMRRRTGTYDEESIMVATNKAACDKYFDHCHAFDAKDRGGNTSNCKQCVAATGYGNTEIHECQYVKGKYGKDICEQRRHRGDYDESKEVAIDETTCEAHFDECHQFDAGGVVSDGVINCKQCVAYKGIGDVVHRCQYVKDSEGDAICERHRSDRYDESKEVATDEATCEAHYDECHQFDIGVGNGGMSNCGRCVLASFKDAGDNKYSCQYAKDSEGGEICERRGLVKYDESKNYADDTATCEKYFDECHQFDHEEDVREGILNCKKCVKADVYDDKKSYKCAYTQDIEGNRICRKASNISKKVIKGIQYNDPKIARKVTSDYGCMTYFNPWRMRFMGKQYLLNEDKDIPKKFLDSVTNKLVDDPVYFKLHPSPNETRFQLITDPEVRFRPISDRDFITDYDKGKLEPLLGRQSLLKKWEKEYMVYNPYTKVIYRPTYYHKQNIEQFIFRILEPNHELINDIKVWLEKNAIWVVRFMDVTYTLNGGVKDIPSQYVDSLTNDLVDAPVYFKLHPSPNETRFQQITDPEVRFQPIADRDFIINHDKGKLEPLLGRQSLEDEWRKEPGLVYNPYTNVIYHQCSGLTCMIKEIHTAILSFLERNQELIKSIEFWLKKNAIPIKDK